MIKISFSRLYIFSLILFSNLHSNSTFEASPASGKPLYKNESCTLQAAEQGNLVLLATIPSISAPEGLNALQAAVTRGHVDCVRYLLYYGINPTEAILSSARNNLFDQLNEPKAVLSIDRMRRAHIYHLLSLANKKGSAE